MTTASIIAKQSLGFRLKIEQSNYYSIGLRSNIIYDLFIVEQSYEDISRNVSNQFLLINDHMHTFYCQSIDQPN